MANQSNCTPVAVKAAYDAVASAYNFTSLHASSFPQIEALFSAIGRMADSYHDIKRLAELGSYLCSDWGNLHDCEREDLEKHLIALGAIIHPEN